jgi:uncharacterized protein YjbI with pentapeptide repeats
LCNAASALPSRSRSDNRRAITGVRDEQAAVEGANLVNVNLKGATLIGANLIDANLIDANLTGVDLTGADLNGAHLEGAAPRPSCPSGKVNISRNSLGSSPRVRMDGTIIRPEFHDLHQRGAAAGAR